MRAMAFLWLWGLLALAVPVQMGVAQNFADVATVSATMGINGGRLCVGEASRGDIGCPTYAPSLTTAGDVSVSGNLQATRFIGDGSGLSGVIAAGSDRIVSGTTSFIVVSDTGYISLTQGGTNTGWFDPTRGLVTLGVSATGGISGTSLYTPGVLTAGTVTGTYMYGQYASFTTVSATQFVGDGSGLTNLSLGATSLSWYNLLNVPTQVQAVSESGAITLSGLTLTGTLSSTGMISASAVTGTYVYGQYASFTTVTAGAAGVGALTATNLSTTGVVSLSGVFSSADITATGRTVTAQRFVGQFEGDGSGLTGVIAAGSDRIVSGTTSFIVVSDTGYISLTQGGTNTGWFDPTRGLVTLGVSATGGISGTSLYTPGILTAGTVTGTYVYGQYASFTTVTAGAAGVGALTATNLSTTGVVSLSGVFSSADITATGRTVTAQRFVGDGSGLTNLPAANTATDRISSTNNQSMVVATGAGTVSYTLGGVAGAAYQHPTLGYVGPGVSTTGGISGSHLYSSGVVRADQGFLSRSGAEEVLISTSQIMISNTFDPGVEPNFVVSLTPGRLAISSIQLLSTALAELNYNQLRIGSSGLGSQGFSVYGYSQEISGTSRIFGTTLLGSNQGSGSSTLHVSGTARVVSWTTINQNVTATVPLDVYGTISSTGVSVTGIVSATRFVGDGSGLTNLPAASTATDRISSTNNQSMVVATGAGTVSLTLSGVAGAAYFHPTLGYVGPGVSTTGGISGTTGYFAGNVGVLTLGVLPSATLHVSGTILATRSAASTDCNDATDDGKLRRNNSTGRYQYCRWTP